MNIHQFKYVIALAELKHFENAAEKCCISQSTLSTMISKLESELGILIFDRKKKPVQLTSEGEQLIEQMKKIVKEIDELSELSREIKGEISGSLTIAVIPTIAPFLLPLFLHHFAKKFPNLSIEVREQTTSEIVRQLKNRTLDIGIVSIPLKDEILKEYKLYDEPFVFYDTTEQTPKFVSANELDVSNLCLLEEGHCMRTQILELCDYFEKHLYNILNFKFKAGSIDSLLRFVKANNASTLLPFLSTIDLSEVDKNRIRTFTEPQPYRSVGLVVHRHFVKHRVLEMLELEIIEKIKEYMPLQTNEGKQLNPV